MSKQPQYIPIAKEAFSDFLDNKTDFNTLMERLRYIELQVLADDEDDAEKTVWFRFFEGDPLKTTITEIEKDLSDPSHPNYQILLRGIALGLGTDELEVHFS